MSKYFFDTEFHEYKKKPLFGKPIDTIELISIGMVDDDGIGPEDGRKYYAICNEFDLKAAWNKWQIKTVPGQGMRIRLKEYWLRDNVLKPIFEELMQRERAAEYRANQFRVSVTRTNRKFTRRNLKYLLGKYGRSGKQIATEITLFCNPVDEKVFTTPKFYAYYADYDWVVFCWLFGRMIDLPKGFPMYCRDLKQMYDEKQHSMIISGEMLECSDITKLKTHPDYPTQDNEHNALDDAKWNLKLFNFLIKNSD